MSKVKSTIQILKFLIFKLSFFIFLFSFFIFFSSPTFAQNKDCSGDQCFINIGERQKARQIPGIPAFDNPNASPGALVSNSLRIMYILGGLAVLVFIVWGAFDWITSGGEKEKVAGAQKKITNSLIGLALLALSAFIVSLVGQIVGIDPTKMGILPTLGQQAP